MKREESGSMYFMLRLILGDAFTAAEQLDRQRCREKARLPPMLP
jgi:hypothetical protein